MHHDYLYMMEDIVDNVASASGFSSLVGLAAYVFSALAIFTIAQRRGIKHPWMAWVPMLNLWILGSISDQYRYVVKGEVKNKRKVLIILQIINFLLVLAGIVKLIVTAVTVVTQGDYMSQAEIIRQLLGILIFFLPVMILGLVSLIFEIMALYDLYNSCDPTNSVLYLVLSLIPAISQITRPLFLFLCRNQDGGMPPRREAPEFFQEPEDYNYTQL